MRHPPFLEHHQSPIDEYQRNFPTSSTKELPSYCKMARFRLLVPGVSFGALLSFCGLSILQAKSQVEDETVEKVPRVAIIGSGIGGSSAAHFVRKILGPDAHIQVFERKDRVGGRLAGLEIAGDMYESGGSIIHPKNMYMKTFVKELGLDTLKPGDGIFSLYNGDELVFQTSSWSWLSGLKLLWRYGLSLCKMKGVTDDLLDKFVNIYSLQEQGEVFQHVPDMLRAIGGEEFYNLTQMSVEKYLQEKGLSQLLIDELVTAIMRINYGQSVQLNAFTGCVSLAGATPGLWAVKGGNWKVCQGLLEKSKATMNMNAHIIEIIKKSQPNQEKPVYYLRSDKALVDSPFDVVIVAMPLEVQENFIGCDGCRQWPRQKELGRFQQTVATFQKAKLNQTTFDYGSHRPSTIGTMEKPEILFNSIGKQTSVLKRNVDDKDGQVWKVFSRKPLTKELKEKLFSQSGDSKEVIWQAYPHYTPPERFLPFVLDEGVFYVNAIEWAASAMEMSALSGRNAALLTGQYLGKGRPVDTEQKDRHSEL